MKSIKTFAQFYQPVFLFGLYYFAVLAGARLLEHFDINSKIILYVQLVLSTAALIWCILRFTRNSDRLAKSSAYGSIFEVSVGYLAIVSLFILLSISWWSSLVLVYPPRNDEPFSDGMAQLDAPPYQLALKEEGRILVFRGELAHGLTKRVEGLLNHNPNVSEISLHSLGGNIFEARGLAQLIIARKLQTYASEECSSACTIVFIAGEKRNMDARARIGFHQYALNYRSAIHGIDIKAEQQRDLDFFLKQGVNADFLNRIYTSPHSEIWYPTSDELIAANVLLP